MAARIIGVIAAFLFLAGVLAYFDVGEQETPEPSARLATGGADTLVCPTCGYNLTGLSESRSPECCAQFTLSELNKRLQLAEDAALRLQRLEFAFHGGCPLGAAQIANELPTGTPKP